MRCGRAQKLIVVALDGEITPARRRALDQHVASCTACGRELAATQALFGAVETLGAEPDVSPRLEAATLRRMRIAAAEEAEQRTAGRWRWLPLPALAAAGVGVLALVIGTRPGVTPEPLPSAPPAPAAARRLAAADNAAARPATARAAADETAITAATPPAEPPADLAAAPDLFMNLPIIRNMEKLEHFEAISMVDLVPNG